jgi:hypothetical protein
MDIYLDQNHWIYLSRAYHGRSNHPEHARVADHLLKKVREGECRIPLALSHLIEHYKEQDSARRERLAVTFEVFSQGWYVANWADIVPQELRRAIAVTLGTGLVFPSPDTVGRGLMFAFGQRARAAIANDWSITKIATIDKHTAAPAALVDLLTFPNEENRLRLRVAAGELGSAAALGAGAMRQVRMSASRSLWRRAQAAENTLQHQQDLMRALSDNGKTIDDFYCLGPEKMTEFWACVASIDTQMELEFYRDRQWTRAIPQNDLGDLGHLAVAVPYFDVVVTEKLWARAAQETHLARKYRTHVLAQLAALSTVPGY